MMLNNPESSALIFHKIRFSLRKRVNFGQAVYVCGNILELGHWDPSKAYRLKWNEVHLTNIQGDIWNGSLLVDGNAPETIEYKYIIADWCNPSPHCTDWEIGTYNRQLDLGTPKSIVICGKLSFTQMIGGTWIKLRSICLFLMVKIAQILIIMWWEIQLSSEIGNRKNK